MRKKAKHIAPLEAHDAATKSDAVAALDDESGPVGPSSMIQAFGEHRDVLASYLAQKLLRPSDIEDVLQETFLRAYSASQKNEISSPKGYLFITARNLLSRKFSRQSREMIREISDAQLAELPANQVTTDMQVHYKIKLDALKEAVQTLPPQCRRVFIMRKFEGKSQKQIARELAISPSTVERHITIALTRLNEKMRSHGFNQDRPAPTSSVSSGLTNESEVR